MKRETNGKCALCGHEPSCGFAMVNDLYLCHADDHSCYHAWTVWDVRPTEVDSIVQVGRVTKP